jgi:acyl-[acyl-carrier-protein] desaturase
MGSAAPRQVFGTPDQIAVLRDLEAFVKQETLDHLERRNLWFPNDLNSADAGKEEASRTSTG